MAKIPEDYTTIKDAVSCVDAFNAVFFCASPGHQVERYYKDGTVDNCNRQLEEMKFCLKLKLSGPKETKRLLTSLLTDEPQPGSATVWELRAPPAQNQ